MSEMKDRWQAGLDGLHESHGCQDQSHADCESICDAVIEGLSAAGYAIVPAWTTGTPSPCVWCCRWHDRTSGCSGRPTEL